jgi:hypothetical protein
MSSNSQFSTIAMNNYLDTIAELERLTAAGATDSEILVAKMYMSIALADLIAPNDTDESRANLVLIFMRSDNPQIYAGMPPLEDVEETLPSTPLIDEDEMDPVELQTGFVALQGGEIDDEMPALD